MPLAPAVDSMVAQQARGCSSADASAIRWRPTGLSRTFGNTTPPGRAAATTAMSASQLSLSMGFTRIVTRAETSRSDNKAAIACRAFVFASPSTPSSKSKTMVSASARERPLVLRWLIARTEEQAATPDKRCAHRSRSPGTRRSWRWRGAGSP